MYHDAWLVMSQAFFIVISTINRYQEPLQVEEVLMPNYSYEDEVKDIIESDFNWESDVNALLSEDDIELIYG